MACHGGDEPQFGKGPLGHDAEESRLAMNGHSVENIVTGYISVTGAVRYGKCVVAAIVVY